MSVVIRVCLLGITLLPATGRDMLVCLNRFGSLNQMMNQWMRCYAVIVMVVAGVFAGCDDGLEGFEPWAITTPPNASSTINDMAGTLADYLELMTEQTGQRITRDSVSNTNVSNAALMIHLAAGPLGFEDDSFRIDIDEGKRKTTLTLYADTQLGHQYAAYEVLRQLGVRLFHPEQEYVPKISPIQLQRRARIRTVIARGNVYRPDFKYRSFTFHGPHPLEHLESFSDASHPIDEAENVNRWMVKNRGAQFRNLGRGIADEASRATRRGELDTLRNELGMYQATGITLHAQQQGGGAELRLDDPDPQQTIEGIVTQRLEDTPDVAYFGIHFGPTELTTTPDEQTVDWMNWAGLAAKMARPDIPVFINNHTTGSQSTSNFSDLDCANGTNESGRGDYYDLSFHTDPSLGVQVHTVMFYPLEGPAPVYKQISFEHKRCLMERASAEGRPLLYFPEGSWWLSFDNAVPVYLPIYMYSRGRDVNLLRPLLASRGEGSLVGHKMFNSGHEWGYWQQDYAVGMWHFNADVTMDEVLYEMTDPLCDTELFPTRCDAQNTAVGIMNEVIEHQVDYFLNRRDYRGMAGGLYFYFAGEDPADEIAESIGLGFRPIRPSFSEVVSWSQQAQSDFRDSDLKALRDADLFYSERVELLQSLRRSVPEAGRVWLDEVIDGLSVNALRARHTWQLYESAIAGVFSPDLTETMQEVEAVIDRRESAYRYPIEQMIGGGVTPETSMSNGTTYPYRVHTKTHLKTYWTYREDQLRALVDAKPAGEKIVLSPVFGPAGKRVDITYPPNLVRGELTIGDVSTSVPTPSVGVPDGILPVNVMAMISGTGQDVVMVGNVVRGGEQRVSTLDGITILQPDNAVVISVLKPLLPRFYLGLNDGLTRMAIAPNAQPVDFESVSKVAIAPVDTTLKSEPFDFTFQLQSGGGPSSVSVTILDLVITTAIVGGLGDVLGFQGDLRLADIVDGLIELAGFDEAGAWATLADFLDFDIDNPPETMPIVFELELVGAMN